MIDILLLTILVAIILGVSLHDAFWTIVGCMIGLTIFIIAIGVFRLSLSFIASRIKRAKKNREQIKKNIANDSVTALVVLWLFSPLILVPLISYLSKDSAFLQQNGWLVLVLGLLPFAGGVIAFLHKVKTIKKTRH